MMKTRSQGKLLLAAVALIPFAGGVAAATAGATPADRDLIAAEVGNSLVGLQNGPVSPVSAERLNNVEYYGIYYTAGWCSPCQRFTPELVEAYQRLRQSHPEVEIVQFSFDHSARDLETYLRQHTIPWPVIAYEARRQMELLMGWRERGIPNLVFVNRRGEVISSTYVQGEFRGPQAALREFEQHLAAKARASSGE